MPTAEQFEMTVYRDYHQPQGKGTEEAPELILYVHISETDYAPGFKVVANFLRAVGDTPEEIPSPSEWGVNEADHIAYHELQVYHQQWKEDHNAVFYGNTELHYDYVSSKASKDLYRMARTMEKIEKGLARIAAKRGEPSGIAEYLGRLCEITGVERLLFTPSERTQARRHRDQGIQYVFCTGGEGINQVRRAVDEIKRILASRAA